MMIHYTYRYPLCVACGQADATINGKCEPCADRESEAAERAYQARRGEDGSNDDGE